MLDSKLDPQSWDEMHDTRSAQKFRNRGNRMHVVWNSQGIVGMSSDEEGLYGKKMAIESARRSFIM